MLLMPCVFFRISMKLLFGAFHVHNFSCASFFSLTNFIFFSFCSNSEIDPEVLEYENWLTLLNQELQNQGISLPERYRWFLLCA